MEFFYLYSIFAIATAFTALYELFIPVIRFEEQLTGVLLEYKSITYITSFLLAILIAPAVFLCCVVPSFSDKFKKAYHLGLFDR